MILREWGLARQLHTLCSMRSGGRGLVLVAFACAGFATSGCSSSPGTSDDDGGTPTGDAAPSDDGAAAVDLDASSDAMDSSAHADAASPVEAALPVDAAADVGATDGGADGGPSPDESVWLDPQNQARAAVGEAPLAWDPIAAQVAQGYAMQCNFQHNPNRGSQYDALGGMGGLGENIAAGAPTQSISGAVGSWVGEEQYYDHATNSCASGQECGHYTQVVWKDTTGVGCAKVSCTTGSPFGSFASGQWDFSVCDYSPPGNVVGQSPY